MKITVVRLLCGKNWIRPAGLSVFAIVIVLLFSTNLAAQISNPGKSSSSADSSKTDTVKKQTASRELPPSRVYEYIKPETSKATRLPKLLEEQKKPSSTMEKKIQIGTVRQLEQQVSNVSQGTVFSVAEGTVWISEITSEDALQTRLRFNKTDLPSGAKLFVYSAKNPDDVYGPYEKRGDSENGDFWTPPFEGDSVIVEYFEPNQNGLRKNKLPFRIVEVSHIYRNPLGFGNGEIDAPTQYPCHNEVPAEWSSVAKSVGHLQFVKNGSEVVCTGTLLSSLTGDFDPILLTANHCISTAAEAQSLRAYWFYNSGDYASSSLPRSDGATLLNTGTASDFTLLKIRGAIPLRAGIVYSGWDATATASGTSVVGIHHPSASHKRFSTGTINAINGNFLNVQWNSGTTEGGSSGSGIWKGTGTNARLIGTLYGIYVGTEGCANPISGYGNFAVTYPYISSNLQGGSDDVYDAGNGNDIRSNAAGIGQGSFSNLIVKYQDSDWYSVNVPAGFKVTATANFTHSYGDIDLALYRGNEPTPISTSESATNSETVMHTATGVATTYYLNAHLYDGARNDYNLNISLQQATLANRKSFDYDGDGKSDVSLFRPANGMWHFLNSATGYREQQFANPGDKIVPADYDGDGKTDIAVYRPSTGVWYLLQSQAGYREQQFGASDYNPVPADYDGDGKADIALYRPSTGVWYLLRSTAGYTEKQFGGNAYQPVAADYDGDGKADIAVYLPANGVWYLLRSTAGYVDFQFGGSAYKPVAADYDGDGRADVAVYLPSNGTWYLSRSTLGYGQQQFGGSAYQPVPADYDGDGKTDMALYLPGNGVWYLLQSTAGYREQQFGGTGFNPTVSAYLP